MAAALLTLRSPPEYGWSGIFYVGEPQRAFYGNQYSLTMLVFTHSGVELWVPEVSGPHRSGLRSP